MIPDAIQRAFLPIKQAIDNEHFDDAVAAIQDLMAIEGPAIRGSAEADSWLVSAWRWALAQAGRSAEAEALFASRVAEERAMIAAADGSLVPVLGAPRRVRYAHLTFDLFVFRHDLLSIRLAAADGWEPGISRYIAAMVQPGDLVIDIGANIGWHTLAAALCVGPTGRVLAFEPEPVTYRLLEASVRENGLGWVDAIAMAIGDADGVVTLHRPFLAGNAQHSMVDHGYNGDSITIPVSPLTAFADLIDRPIRLLKMDIEGAEDQALAGMEPLLGGPFAPQVMILEFSPRLLAQAGSGPERFDALTTRFGYGFAVLASDTGEQIPMAPGQSLSTLFDRVMAGETGSATQFDVVFMR